MRQSVVAGVGGKARASSIISSATVEDLKIKEEEENRTRDMLNSHILEMRSKFLEKYALLEEQIRTYVIEFGPAKNI